jgi:hypothetical protein
MRKNTGSRFRSFVLASTIALTSVLDGPGGVGPVQAQDQAAITEKLKELNRQALADYATGDHESAKLSLLEAIGVATKAGLSDSALMARTYAHLGAIYVNGFGDKTKGQKALTTALKIRGDLKLTPATVTPTLEEVFAAAQKDVNGTPPPAPAVAPEKPAPNPVPAPQPTAGKPAPAIADKVAVPAVAEDSPKKAAEKAAEKPPEKAQAKVGPEEPDLPASIAEPLHCPNPDEAPPRQPIALRCVVQPELKVTRVLLFYRLPGGEKFASVRTVRSPKGWWNGVIPPDAVVGKTLQYYFEARDPSDQVAGSNGRGESPNVMMIRAGASSVGKGAMAMLRFQRRQGSGGGGPEEDPLAGIAEEKVREERDAGDRRRRVGSVFFGGGVGMGRGYQPSADRPLEFYGQQYQDPRTKDVYPAKTIGPAWLPAGIADIVVEVGYQWSDQWAFSAQARYEFIASEGVSDPRPGRPATGAFSILARAQRLFGEGNLQGFVSGTLGGGDGFRLTTKPQPNDDKFKAVPRNDSVRGGPLVLGPGGGGLLHISRNVAVTAELRPLIGLPDLAFLLDFWAGLQLGF